MLNKFIIASAYVVSGLESALKSTDLVNQAEVEACDMLTKIAPGKDVIADSAWTYSFLCSHLYLKLLVQSWLTESNKTRAKKLFSTAKDYVVYKLGFQTDDIPTFDEWHRQVVADLESESRLTAEPAVKPGQLQRLREECITVAQAAEQLDCSTAKVLDLIASGGLDIVADDFVSQHSIDLYLQHETMTSSFSTTPPPNNGSPNTSGSGGSR